MAYTSTGDGDDETAAEDEACEPMVKHRHDRKRVDRNGDGNGHTTERRSVKSEVLADGRASSKDDNADDDVSDKLGHLLNWRLSFQICTMKVIDKLHIWKICFWLWHVI